MHDAAPDAEYVPAGQMPVHDVAREQPAPLYQPAGQSAQALQWEPMQPGQTDRPVSYSTFCPAPPPLYP